MDISEYAREIKMPTSICFASKRCSGKSVMVNQMLKTFVEEKKVDSIIIFSNTARLNDDYPDFPMSIKHEFSEGKLQKIINHQKKLPKEKRKHIMIVLDDLLGDRSAKNSDLIVYAYAISRHINISPILISQVGNHILTPTIKNNSERIFLSRLNRGQLIGLWETSITNIDKNDFVSLVEHINKDFNFIVIDNTSQSNNPEEFISVVRAALPDKRTDKPAESSAEK